jgi:biofilm protein TabA
VVVDTISNHRLYRGLGEAIATGLGFIAGVAGKTFSERTVELDGRKLYAMFQSYETEPVTDRFYEAHRRYVDIQYLVSGEEIIRVRNVDGLEVRDPYNETGDFELYHLTDNGTDVRLRPGDFAILFPEDAHAPKIANGNPGSVEKIVIKVLLG